MENLLVLLICFGILTAVIVPFVRRSGAWRELMKPPLLEEPPLADRAAAAPAQPPTIDAAVAVAIASAVNAIAPGARIIQIEEEL
ncbi:MAG: hypothetical protein KDJ22_10045 [Candidatus Competibacteraceae bacterium]|nr:hypothetical protein [Candidatus Competibacteraceae bacterium]MCP5126796.1 hypothetical protein [Gammaproteobacteria bacterium]